MKLSEIGAALKSALAGDEDIQRLCNDRIFPVWARAGAQQVPLLTYRVTGRTGDNTKDGEVMKMMNVEITCVAAEYTVMTELASAVEEAVMEIAGADDVWVIDYNEYGDETTMWYLGRLMVCVVV